MTLTAGCLRFSDPDALRLIEPVLHRLPDYEGKVIHISFRPDLRVKRNRLFSRGTGGNPVHAGSDIARRNMVLDRELLANPSELKRIFVHELYHFAWVRLGNPRRREFEHVLCREFDRHARGELGWSAESMKRGLQPSDRRRRTRRWRAYVCESFCDTAAWVYSGVSRHAEWTLPAQFRSARKTCFAGLFDGSAVPI